MQAANSEFLQLGWQAAKTEADVQKELREILDLTQAKAHGEHCAGIVRTINEILLLTDERTAMLHLETPYMVYPEYRSAIWGLIRGSGLLENISSYSNGREAVFQTQRPVLISIAQQLYRQLEQNPLYKKLRQEVLRTNL